MRAGSRSPARPRHPPWAPQSSSHGHRCGISASDASSSGLEPLSFQAIQPPVLARCVLCHAAPSRVLRIACAKCSSVCQPAALSQRVALCTPFSQDRSRLGLQAATSAVPCAPQALSVLSLFCLPPSHQQLCLASCASGRLGTSSSMPCSQCCAVWQLIKTQLQASSRHRPDLLMW